jgi:multiple sugar transport system permease protein
MLLLPLFVLFISIQSFIHAKLVGTYTGVIITYLTFSLPFATWLLVTYLGNIPLDIEEAAMIDGATRLQTLWRIVVPLALPGLVVALIFSFLTGKKTNETDLYISGLSRLDHRRGGERG